MSIPTLLLRIFFTLAAAGFCLLVGAALGTTVFGDRGGHGMAGIVNMFAGGGIGFVIGVLAAVLLIFKFKLRGSALKAGILISLIGATLTFLMIQILDAYDMW